MFCGLLDSPVVHSQKILISENPRSSRLWKCHNLPLCWTSCCWCRFSALQMVRFISQMQGQMDSSANQLPSFTTTGRTCQQSHTHLPRGFYDNTFATTGRQNITSKWFQQCPASFSLRCPKEDTSWLQTIPLPIFQLLNRVSDDRCNQ